MRSHYEKGPTVENAVPSNAAQEPPRRGEADTKGRDLNLSGP